MVGPIDEDNKGVKTGASDDKPAAPALDFVVRKPKPAASPNPSSAPAIDAAENIDSDAVEANSDQTTTTLSDEEIAKKRGITVKELLRLRAIREERSHQQKNATSEDKAPQSAPSVENNETPEVATARLIAERKPLVLASLEMIATQLGIIADQFNQHALNTMALQQIPRIQETDAGKEIMAQALLLEQKYGEENDILREKINTYRKQLALAYQAILEEQSTPLRNLLGLNEVDRYAQTYKILSTPVTSNLSKDSSFLLKTLINQDPWVVVAYNRLVNDTQKTEESLTEKSESLASISPINDRYKILANIIQLANQLQASGLNETPSTTSFLKIVNDTRHENDNFKKHGNDISSLEEEIEASKKTLDLYIKAYRGGSPTITETEAQHEALVKKNLGRIKEIEDDIQGYYLHNISQEWPLIQIIDALTLIDSLIRFNKEQLKKPLDLPERSALEAKIKEQVDIQNGLNKKIAGINKKANKLASKLPTNIPEQASALQLVLNETKENGYYQLRLERMEMEIWLVDALINVAQNKARADEWNIRELINTFIQYLKLQNIQLTSTFDPDLLNSIFDERNKIKPAFFSKETLEKLTKAKGKLQKQYDVYQKRLSDFKKAIGEIPSAESTSAYRPQRKIGAPKTRGAQEALNLQAKEELNQSQDRPNTECIGALERLENLDAETVEPLNNINLFNRAPKNKLPRTSWGGYVDDCLKPITGIRTFESPIFLNTFTNNDDGLAKNNTNIPKQRKRTSAEVALRGLVYETYCSGENSDPFTRGPNSLKVTPASYRAYQKTGGFLGRLSIPKLLNPFKLITFVMQLFNIGIISLRSRIKINPEKRPGLFKALTWTTRILKAPFLALAVAFGFPAKIDRSPVGQKIAAFASRSLPVKATSKPQQVVAINKKAKLLSSKTDNEIRSINERLTTTNEMLSAVNSSVHDFITACTMRYHDQIASYNKNRSVPDKLKEKIISGRLDNIETTLLSLNNEKDLLAAQLTPLKDRLKLLDKKYREISNKSDEQHAYFIAQYKTLRRHCRSLELAYAQKELEYMNQIDIKRDLTSLSASQHSEATENSISLTYKALNALALNTNKNGCDLQLYNNPFASIDPSTYKRSAYILCNDGLAYINNQGVMTILTNHPFLLDKLWKNIGYRLIPFDDDIQPLTADEQKVISSILPSHHIHQSTIDEIATDLDVFFDEAITTLNSGLTLQRIQNERLSFILETAIHFEKSDGYRNMAEDQFLLDVNALDVNNETDVNRVWETAKLITKSLEEKERLARKLQVVSRPTEEREPLIPAEDAEVPQKSGLVTFREGVTSLFGRFTSLFRSNSDYQPLPTSSTEADTNSPVLARTNSSNVLGTGSLTTSTDASANALNTGAPSHAGAPLLPPNPSMPLEQTGTSRNFRLFSPIRSVGGARPAPTPKIPIAPQPPIASVSIFSPQLSAKLASKLNETLRSFSDYNQRSCASAQRLANAAQTAARSNRSS